MRRVMILVAAPALLAAGLLLLTGCTKPQPEGDGVITGRVAHDGVGIPMAVVEAYTRPEQDRTTPPLAETVTGEEGRFELALPAGKYWVWAKATVQTETRELRLVGQAAPNPVEPGVGERVTVVVDLEDPSGFAGSAGPAGAGAAGTVTGADPDDRVTVYVYQGHEERPVGPGFLAATELDEDHGFQLNLAPGAYTLAARVRQSGHDYGPPAVGDRIAIRPVTVEEDEYVMVGELALHPVDEILWAEVTGTMGDSPTTLSGAVVETDGSPARGVRVLAFLDGRMSGKPAAVSPATGGDGVFTIQLPRGGSYYLGARSRLGGPAAPGEKLGQYRGPGGEGQPVKSGEAVTGIEITVEEVW